MNEIISTEVIVLKKTKYKESSLIISTISPDFGKIDFVIKGAYQITKTKQPIVDLFRILAVEYKENNSGLYSPTTVDLQKDYDSIALKPTQLSQILSFTPFLLKNIHPHVSCSRVYKAFNNLLQNTIDDEFEIYSINLIKLVYLHENGLLPDILSSSGCNENRYQNFLNRILNYAVNASNTIPQANNEYWVEFNKWVRNMCHYHEL